VNSLAYVKFIFHKPQPAYMERYLHIFSSSSSSSSSSLAQQLFVSPDLGIPLPLVPTPGPVWPGWPYQ
jgi:hypothetical protein